MKQDGYSIVSELSTKLLKRASDKAMERSLKARSVYKNLKDPVARTITPKAGSIAKAGRAKKYAQKKMNQAVNLHSKI